MLKEDKSFLTFLGGSIEKYSCFDKFFIKI